MANSTESEIVSQGASWGSWAARKLADGLDYLSNLTKTEGSYDNLKSKLNTAWEWTNWAIDGVKSFVSKLNPSSEVKVAETSSAPITLASAAKPDAGKAFRDAESVRPVTRTDGGVSTDTVSAGAIPAAAKDASPAVGAR